VDDNIVQTNYNAKLNTRSLFINGFFDFRSFSLGYTSIKPYLGGGIGVSRNKMDDVLEFTDAFPGGAIFPVTSASDTTVDFAFKLTAGMFVTLTEKISLSIDYQYVDLGAYKGGHEILRRGNVIAVQASPIAGGDITSGEFMVGLQFNF
tara:strand:- start:1116 stop:1562 length:447 start_codon:yes stop_codon:yes gene_type:complete